MTWATKDTNKKLELVPDKDPTYGGLVQGAAPVAKYADYVSTSETIDELAAIPPADPVYLYDKKALDVLSAETKFYRSETYPSPFFGPYGPGSLAAYPPSTVTSDMYDLRKEISQLRREIAELREELRRSIYAPAHPAYVYAAPIMPSGKGKTIKWPF